MSSCTVKQAKYTDLEPSPLVKNYVHPSLESKKTNEFSEHANDEKLSGPITLHQALSLAIAKNPELEVFSFEVRAAESREQQAGLFSNPELEIEIEDFAGEGDLSGFSGAESTLAIGQLIELGGKRGKRERVASLSKRLQDWNYESKRLDVFTKTSRAFIDVLVLQRRLALANESLDLSKKMHNLVSEKVEAGKESPLEKTKADVMLSTTQIVELSIAKQLEAARKTLASFWGDSFAEFSNVEGDLETLYSLPPIETLTPLISQNPDIRSLNVALELRESEVVLAESSRVPDVTLRGGIKRFEETSDYGFAVGISVPLGIFDRNQGGIQEARHNMASTRSLKNAEKIRIEAELIAAYQELSSAYYQATTLKNTVMPAASSALEASSEGYTQGKLEYLDVLDAQRTLYEVKSQYIQSLSSYHKATIEVERRIGQRIYKETSYVR
tara:strand:- start:3566 stop:4894 length:1329 start_codon:yes stop_codon:yes gene_type:complete